MFERKKPSGKLLSLPIDQIHPSPFQARKSFDEQELTALAQSIRENGLLQPVTVRRAAEGYELVAGGAAAARLSAGKDDHHPRHPVQLRRRPHRCAGSAGKHPARRPEPL